MRHHYTQQGNCVTVKLHLSKISGGPRRQFKMWSHRTLLLQPSKYFWKMLTIWMDNFLNAVSISHEENYSVQLKRSLTAEGPHCAVIPSGWKGVCLTTELDWPEQRWVPLSCWSVFLPAWASLLFSTLTLSASPCPDFFPTLSPVDFSTLPTVTQNHMHTSTFNWLWAG